MAADRATSAPPPTPMSPPGPALRSLRLQRRMSQRMLAARSGIDPSTISRLERGLAATMTLTVFNRLAAGLGCAPEELMIPVSATGRPTKARPPRALVELQRALIGTSLDSLGSARPVSRDTAAQIAAVRRLRVAGSYAEAATAAARCLPAAHMKITGGREVRPSRERLVHLCFDAALVARRLGDAGSAWIAAERAQQAAALTRLAPMIAGATFGRSYVALGRDLPSRALQIAESYLSDAPPASPELAALQGMLHLCAALAVSRSRGGTEQRDKHLAHAERLLEPAEGDTDPFALHFDHETLWQWRMKLALETRDHATAATALSRIRLDRISQPHRQAVYFIDLARFYVATDRWDGAVSLLARADRIASEHVATSRAAVRLRDYLSRRTLSEPSQAWLRRMDRQDGPPVREAAPELDVPAEVDEDRE